MINCLNLFFFSELSRMLCDFTRKCNVKIDSLTIVPITSFNRVRWGERRG